MREAGMERVSPIKELLPEEVSYFMIRAYLEKQKQFNQTFEWKL
jgi:ATP-dependent DNA helicase RecQ